MYEDNFFIKYVIIYYTIDVCNKQYRFVNTLWLSSVLEFTYLVIIDVCINAPGHGRRKIDGIDGSEKSYLRQNIAW